MTLIVPVVLQRWAGQSVVLPQRLRPMSNSREEPGSISIGRSVLPQTETSALPVWLTSNVKNLSVRRAWTTKHADDPSGELQPVTGAGYGP